VQPTCYTSASALCILSVDFCSESENCGCIRRALERNQVCFLLWGQSILELVEGIDEGIDAGLTLGCSQEQGFLGYYVLDAI
jgi:hypothetical protein